MVTSIRLIAVNTGEVIAANIWGKAKTVSQMVAIVGILIMQYLQELIGLCPLCRVLRRSIFQQCGILVCGKRFSRYFILYLPSFQVQFYLKQKLEFV
ncbi:MAG: CDP-alcohol phosphatidyltransferase family protein [Eubacteriales bacterium]